MSIIHFGAMTAAGSGNPADDLNLPVGGFEAQGASSPWSAYGVVQLYGDTNDANEGTYSESESYIGTSTGDWITDTSEIDQWLIRMVDATEINAPSNDLTLYYGGGWTNGQSNWEAFGSGSYLGITVETNPTFGCGWSYGLGGETIDGTLEFAKGARGLAESFGNADVSTGGDTITITAHGFSQGDGVLFSDGGGTAPSPLVDGTVYYIIDDGVNSIQLGTSMSAVDSTESPINITTTGTGTFSLTRIEADGSCSIFVDADD